jgi:hypothetical protein
MAGSGISIQQEFSTMRRLSALAAVVAVSVIGFAPAASAAASVCYDVSVQINDQGAAQADCVNV